MGKAKNDEFYTKEELWGIADDLFEDVATEANKDNIHIESLDLIKAEFEKQIHSECAFCKEPILYGEDYYYNGYDHMCSKCMGKFESKQARLTE